MGEESNSLVMIAGAVATAILTGGTFGAALIWVSKRALASVLEQNKTLINYALENVRANTAAINANTKASNELAQIVRVDRLVQNERDMSMQKQLDRIEDRFRPKRAV